MIPYLHVGPLTLPTFGLMVAIALMSSAYILQADFHRRGWNADAFLMITIAGILGILGAKVMHVIDTPSDRVPLNMVFNPHWLLSGESLRWFRFGLAWFGSLIAGFFVMLFLGWRSRLPLLPFLDACSPAASFGYAIGRIGCFLSGDGDYGKPTSLPWGMSFPNGVVPTTETCVQWGAPADCRVHPAPLYELILWCAMGALLWYLGTKALRTKKETNGQIFCGYLILTGVARFLVEIIRINPPALWGLSSAQLASIASAIAGVALLVYVSRSRKASDRGTRPAT